MENKIAARVKEVPPSGIRKFFDIANSMEGVISLGVGEPDFVSPWNVREACIYSLEKGMTYYTSNWGMPELRKAISTYLSLRFGVDYNPENEIIVTVVAIEAIDLALRAILEPEDEVLIPDPSYVAYMPCVRFCGAKPVAIECSAEDGFRITPEHLKKSITSKTKALILPYPNNPTGGIMTREDLEAISEVLRDTDILVISDEIYAELTYEGKHTSIANIPDMKERTILINGFSKAFAMTGWRLGYAAGHPDLIGAMVKIHQYTTLCAPIMAQVAALEALNKGFEDGFASVEYMVRQYNRRRKVIVNGFREIGLDCFEPMGAFYVFPSIKKTRMTSEEFCERLLMDQKVAVVPGTAFGSCGEGFIRCSYAYSIENINEALKRIGNFIKKL